MSRTTIIHHLTLTLALAAMAFAPARLVSSSTGVWTSHGPDGGVIFGLAIDPTSPATVYAATYDGVFKSTDGAASWSPVNTGLTNFAVNALAIDPLTPSTLYAGTVRGGVFKSTHGGGRWRPLNAGLPHVEVRDLALDPTGSGSLYAGTAGRGVVAIQLLTVDAVSPGMGLASAGTALTVRGDHSLPGATLAVGVEAAISVTVVNSTTLTAVTGTHAAGAADVVVTNPDVHSAALPNGFFFADTIYLSYLPNIWWWGHPPSQPSLIVTIIQ